MSYDSLRFEPHHLAQAKRWNELEALLTDLAFLEAKIQAGLVLELVNDFEAALAALPASRPQRQVLWCLLAALKRDLHFIAAHIDDYPQALFQCLWNNCWWVDSPAAAQHFDAPPNGWPPEGPPWSRPGPKLFELLNRWESEWRSRNPGCSWIKSLRPPVIPLEESHDLTIRIDLRGLRVVGLGFEQSDTVVAASTVPFGTADLSDKTIHLWSAASGKQLGEKERRIDIRDRTISADGQLQVRVADDGSGPGNWGRSLTLWDLGSGRALASLETDPDVLMWGAAISMDGSKVIAGGYGMESSGEIMIWNTDTHNRIVPKFVEAPIFGAVALSDDGGLAAAGDANGVVYLWDANSGERLNVLHTHETTVRGVAFSDGGNRIVSASNDGTIRISNISHRSRAGILKEHPDTIVDIVFSIDGARLVTRSENNSMWLWEARTGNPIACLVDECTIMLSGGYARPSLLVDETRVISFAHGHQTAPGAFGYAEWRANDGHVVRMPGRGLYWSETFAFSNDGSYVLCVEGEKTDARVAALEPAAEWIVLKGHSAPLTCHAFSFDGTRVAAGSEDMTVRVWQLDGGQEMVHLEGHEGPISCVTFSADDRRIATGGADSTIRIWDTSSGKQVACLQVDDPGVWQEGWSASEGEWKRFAVVDIAFTPDGTRLFTISLPRGVLSERIERELREWDLEHAECRRSRIGFADHRAAAANLDWQAYIRGAEIEIQTANGRSIAWLPLSVGAVISHSSGRIWTGSVGTHLYLFALESVRPGDSDNQCEINERLP